MAMDYVIEAGGIGWSDVDLVCCVGSDEMTFEEAVSKTVWLGPMDPARVLHVPEPAHHLSHAYATFYASGFSEAAALVVDVYGSPLVSGGREQESGYRCRKGEPQELVFRSTTANSIVASPSNEKLLLRNGSEMTYLGIGEVYSLVSQVLGFVTRTGPERKLTIYNEAGKTMGLAPYGRQMSKEPVMIRVTDAGIDTSNTIPFLR